MLTLPLCAGIGKLKFYLILDRPWCFLVENRGSFSKIRYSLYNPNVFSIMKIPLEAFSSIPDQGRRLKSV